MNTDVFATIPQWLPGWIAAGGSAGGTFVVIRYFLEFASGRIDKRNAALDADTRFVIENMRAELARVSDRLSSTEKDVTHLREQLHECEKKHLQSEAKAARLEAMVQGYGTARDMVQVEQAASAVLARTLKGIGEQ